MTQFIKTRVVQYAVALTMSLAVAGCGGAGGGDSAATATATALAVAAPASESVAAVALSSQGLSAAAVGDNISVAQALNVPVADAPTLAPAVRQSAGLATAAPILATSAPLLATATAAASSSAVTTLAVPAAQISADALVAPSSPQARSSPVVIQTADIVFKAGTTGTAASVQGDLQCLGNLQPLASTATAIYGVGASGSAELRYGWVPDPAGGGKTVNYFAVRSTDPDTAGAGNKRCENGFYYNGQAIPWDQDFWFTTAVRTAPLAGTTDIQSVWQWHDGSSTSGLSPYLAAEVSGNQLVIRTRSNQNSILTPSNTSVSDLYRSSNWSADTWYQFTVQARLDSKNNGNSYVRIWLNGVQIVNRVGPIGYVYANPKDYVKNGLYHWTGAGNAWQEQAPKREAWFKGPAMVLHRSGYTSDAMAALIN